MKARDVRKWTMEDIKDVQEHLPDGIKFAQLSSSSESAVKLDLGMALELEEIEPRIEAAIEALEKAGVPPMKSTAITAGYAGTTSPHILAYVRFDGDD